MRIEVWADGSGTVSTGPACIGVLVCVDGVPTVEVSEFVGLGTNNVAELRAIRRALWLVSELVRQGGDRAAKVTVYSDSLVSLQLIRGKCEPKKNERLVRAVRSQVALLRSGHLKKFPGEARVFLEFEHVFGHAGELGNETADYLAGRARVAWFAAPPRGIVKPAKRRPK